MVPRTWAVCFVLCAAMSGGLAQEQKAAPYDCRVANLPTVWAFDNPPGTIERNNAAFGESGRAWLDFQFRNRESTSIQALTLIVEYADKEDEIIDRVPFVGTVTQGITDSLPFVLSPSQAWKNALSPGDSARMERVSDGIRTGRCPVRARVTFASLRFTDGTLRTFSSPQWQSGPVPTLIPTLPETIPELPVQPPVSLLAKLKISAMGDVLDVVSEEPESLKLLGWIRDRMRQDWKFHPARLKGKSTDSELTVLFLIHSKGMIKFVESKPVLQPITLIQFYWSHDLFGQVNAMDRWTVTYGALQEGSIPN